MDILLSFALGALAVFLWLNKFKDKNIKLEAELEAQAKNFEFVQNSKEKMDQAFAKISAEVLKKDSANLNQ